MASAGLGGTRNIIYIIFDAVVKRQNLNDKAKTRFTERKY